MDEKAAICQLGLSEWIQIIQCLILFVTAIIVCWYTCETKKLREETQKQTDQMIQPFLFLFLEDDKGSKLKFVNLSKSPALNIYMEPLYISGEDYLRLRHDQPITLLSEKSNYRPNLDYVFENGTVSQQSSHIAAALGGDERIDIAFTFYNAVWMKFRTVGYFENGLFHITAIETKF